MNPHTTLPDSESVDTRTLARLFARVTNSYKFLFFLSLLENLERNSFDATVPMSLYELSIDMLVIAWYPHVYFRLSFGKQDRIGQALDRIFPHAVLSGSLKPSDRQAIKGLIKSETTNSDLERYVPYRLIRPFFPETRELTRDHDVNLTVAELCQEYFVSRKPPYRFDESKSNIYIHPAWAQYLKDNFSIVKSWTYWEFLQYMQRRNPNVPAVANKLLPPNERQSLEKEAKYWRAIIEVEAVFCIYSGERITAKNLALDHYIPWSFVVHNQLWNLIPVIPEVNSSKSNRLPAADYLSKFIDAQHAGLSTASKIFSTKARDDHFSSFMSDLALPDAESILDRDKLGRAYELTLAPLTQLATINGFEADWRYRR